MTAKVSELLDRDITPDDYEMRGKRSSEKSCDSKQSEKQGCSSWTKR